MTETHIRGLVAATFTPFDARGSFVPETVASMVSHLDGSGISAMFVCGTTGEGPTLTVEERKNVAAAYAAAAEATRLKIIVHVGHDSIRASEELAAHAAELGVHAVAATPPSFFKIDSVERLTAHLAQISSAAPALPIYYYHIPALTGVRLDMLDFLRVAEKRLPGLAGIKYTAPELHTFMECARFAGGRYDMLYGTDEQLLGGLAMGARGAIGSTYNFLAPLYLAIIRAFDDGDMETARDLQAKSAEFVRLLVGAGGFAGLKTAMKLAGIDCGPLRLPNTDPPPGVVEELRNRLEAAGFFEWVTSPAEV